MALEISFGTGLALNVVEISASKLNKISSFCMIFSISGRKSINYNASITNRPNTKFISGIASINLILI